MLVASIAYRDVPRAYRGVAAWRVTGASREHNGKWSAQDRVVRKSALAAALTKCLKFCLFRGGCASSSLG